MRNEDRDKDKNSKILEASERASDYSSEMYHCDLVTGKGEQRQQGITDDVNCVHHGQWTVGTIQLEFNIDMSINIGGCMMIDYRLYMSSGYSIGKKKPKPMM